MNTNKRNDIRKLGKDIRQSVVIAELCMTAYCLWLILTDNKLMWMGFLFGFTPFGVTMLLKASDLYGLCNIHKWMIAHVLAVSCCMMFEYEVGFGCMLRPMRALMFALGLALIIKLSLSSAKAYKTWKRSNKK